MMTHYDVNPQVNLTTAYDSYELKCVVGVRTVACSIFTGNPIATVQTVIRCLRTVPR